ncbi:MAG TPA: A24 family peptidase [Gammaproteobacteria bacterium]|nr:A24 family peptidase [Gammaproteobacteria bacterium]
MDLLQLLQASPPVFIVVCAVLGLIVGSFLNVVIHRVPFMLDREWREQCRELLEEPPAEPTPEPLNLVTPASRCPHCGHRIRAWENIPVLSYLLLRARCSECGARISPRYPIVELLTGALSATVAWHFGFEWQAGAALLLTWALIPLSAIDIDHQLLPDAITLPWLWLGLALSLWGVFVDSPTAIIGALAGYLVLWTVYQLFKLVTGKEGMGYGDFKLLALLGAWMGWQQLPVIILLSSLVGAVVGIGMITLLGRDRQIPIPFGPYLAAAGWIALLWGHDLTQAYLHWARL